MYNSQFSQHNWAVSASLLFPFRRVHQGVVGVSYGTGTHWAYITLHDDTPVANFSARRSFAGEKRIIEFWMFGKSLKLFVCRYYIMNSLPFARLFSTIAFVLGVFHTRSPTWLAFEMWLRRRLRLSCKTASRAFWTSENQYVLSGPVPRSRENNLLIMLSVSREKECRW